MKKLYSVLGIVKALSYSLWRTWCDNFYLDIKIDLDILKLGLTYFCKKNGKSFVFSVLNTLKLNHLLFSHFRFQQFCSGEFSFCQYPDVKMLRYDHVHDVQNRNSANELFSDTKC